MAKKKDKRHKGTGKAANKAGTRNPRIAKRAKMADKDTPVIIQDWNNNLRGLYNDELLPIIERHAEAGLNNRQIADAMCIGERTFYEWRYKHPQVALALAKYRQVANIAVENALYANCIGYNYKEQMATLNGKVVEVLKHKAGETKAQIFWLTNRLANKWKQKVETTIALPQDISQLAFAIKRHED